MEITVTNKKLVAKTTENSSWNIANSALLKKAISEFAHEKIIIPKKIANNNGWDEYRINSDISNISYCFEAKIMSLDHWYIKESSIKKYDNNTLEALDLLMFILEFKEQLNIPLSMLPTYMEEITSTLYSYSYKINNEFLNAKELANASFQEVEQSMLEGHPCFIANSGRIGFNTQEYLKYAPETATSFKLVWLAGHKNKTSYQAIKQLPYKVLLEQELGNDLILKFDDILISKGLNPNDYVFIPVHPWQWENKIAQIFTQEIETNNLVFLDNSEDVFLAQQSIRTLFNKSDPNKFYTKTALSIINMGFMRGMSPYYMESTPIITEWITALLKDDMYLNNLGFTMLGEVATVGYRSTYYESLGRSIAHNKMLATLWRETPFQYIKSNQKVITMAALLHRDSKGNSMLYELIKSSMLSTEKWLEKYLSCYLKPLLHCFYKYRFVFMPHGENLILVLENNIPIKAIIKDITEEVIVFNEDILDSETVKRLYTNTTDEMQLLSIFTDVFDSFFRFLSEILTVECNFEEHLFWKLVADSIHDYQKEFPEFKFLFKQFNLFQPEFKRCCLNRLQLSNSKQMLDLNNPIESLKLEGVLQNPIAIYASN